MAWTIISAVFFGPQGDTRWNQGRLTESLGSAFHHHELDIRNRQGVLDLLFALKPEAIVHTAAQPSHDRAAAIPFDDFDTNAVGTPGSATRKTPLHLLLSLIQNPAFPSRFTC